MKEPLAFRIRPTSLDEIKGQEHLFNQDGILRKMVENNSLFSMIFYGPPGSGKTTTAMVLADLLQRPYRLFNAVTGNKKELDGIFMEAKMSNGLVLIMDEVHRLNKDRQDNLLPHLEDGLITLIGATTANPLFAINPAIRSRTHLIEFKTLTKENISQIINQALQHPKGFNDELSIEQSALELIVNNSNGDSRYALNLLELAALNASDNIITYDGLVSIAPKINISFSKDGDNYYDTLSAFQKSIRGSDVQASLYYLAKLIEANDLISIERRLLTIAYEDIGLANPQLVSRVLIAIESAKRVGFPEGRIMLANAVVELALSPKSKSANIGIDRALHSIRTNPTQTPDYLRLTPVSLDEADKYDYSRSDIWHKIQYLPDEVKDEIFYEPQNLNSNEKVLKNNLDELSKIKRSSNLRALKKNNYQK